MLNSTTNYCETRRQINEEEPLLLNPLFDNPSEYFELYFKIASFSNERVVILKPKADLDKASLAYKRALTTIKILNLDLSRTDKKEEKVFTRHELLMEFSNDLIEFAIRRRLMKPKDFLIYCDKQKKHHLTTKLFSLGLMSLIFKGQFKINKLVFNAVIQERNILNKL